MRRAVKLPNIHDVVFVLQYSSLIVVHVEVVGSREDGHDTGETGCPRLAVHTVPCVLGLMGSDDGEEVVFLEEVTRRRIREEVRATSDMVVEEIIIRLLLTKVLKGVSPENVTHDALSRGLAEAINLYGWVRVCAYDSSVWHLGEKGTFAHF